MKLGDINLNRSTNLLHLLLVAPISLTLYLLWTSHGPVYVNPNLTNEKQPQDHHQLPRLVNPKDDKWPIKYKIPDQMLTLAQYDHVESSYEGYQRNKGYSVDTKNGLAINVTIDEEFVPINTQTTNNEDGVFEIKGMDSKLFQDLAKKIDIQHPTTSPSPGKAFYQTILTLVKKCQPLLPAGGIDNPSHYNTKNKNIKTGKNKIPTNSGNLRENHKDEPIRTKKYLDSFLQLSTVEKQRLTNSHQCFVDNMPQEFPPDLINSNESSGYLYIGGGKYDWLVLVSLLQLRSTGAVLPLEVLIPRDEEYNYHLCESVYPKFNAKCLILQDHIDTSELGITSGFQFKSLGLLISSFTNVMMLDSDNFPLKNPDLLFLNEPFSKHGMIVWPDFWRRSIGPSYYEIAGIQVNDTQHVRSSYGDSRDTPKGYSKFVKKDFNNKVSFHDLLGTIPESSSETGQLLLNKTSHAKAIFLSVYYNLLGPDYYYPLLSQGQAGEGDKDTFIAAAHQQLLPYYQVKEYVREFGCKQTDETQAKIFDMDIAAMGQYDPIIDYIQFCQSDGKYVVKWEHKKETTNWNKHRFAHSEMMFLHTNQPKLFPWLIESNGDKTIHDHEGLRRRLYSKKLIKEVGFDFERKIWEHFEWILCVHSNDIRIPELSKGPKEMRFWCKQVLKQKEFLKWDSLFGDSKDSKIWPYEEQIAKGLEVMYPSYQMTDHLNKD